MAPSKLLLLLLSTVALAAANPQRPNSTCMVSATCSAPHPAPLTCDRTACPPTPPSERGRQRQGCQESLQRRGQASLGRCRRRRQGLHAGGRKGQDEGGGVPQRGHAGPGGGDGRRRVPGRARRQAERGGCRGCRGHDEVLHGERRHFPGEGAMPGGCGAEPGGRHGQADDTGGARRQAEQGLRLALPGLMVARPLAVSLQTPQMDTRMRYTHAYAPYTRTPRAHAAPPPAIRTLLSFFCAVPFVRRIRGQLQRRIAHTHTPRAHPPRPRRPRPPTCWPLAWTRLVDGGGGVDSAAERGRERGWEGRTNVPCLLSEQTIRSVHVVITDCVAHAHCIT